MGAKNSCVKKEKGATAGNQRSERANPARHPYDEIDDDELKANQEQQAAAKHAAEAEAVYDDAASAPAENHAPPTRIHPYDEISEDQLASNRKAAKKHKNGIKRKSKSPEVVTEQGKEVTSPTKDVEYLNVEVKPARKPEETNGLTEEELDQLYAKPIKSPTLEEPKSNPPAQLNYIEVEFNPKTTKPQIKRPRSPTNYTNVMNENGKVVLVNDS